MSCFSKFQWNDKLGTQLMLIVLLTYLNTPIEELVTNTLKPLVNRRNEVNLSNR